MFRCFVIIGLLVLPGTASAAVGISPSALEATLSSGAVQDGTILFMRDDKDSETAMYVTVFSDNAFILTEGAEYYMDVGERELSIPYRFDSITYVPGTYTGIFYIRPERAESRVVGNGVSVQVQGGVRAAMTVTTPTTNSWSVAAQENIRDHIAVYRDTASYYARSILASVRQIIRAESK